MAIDYTKWYAEPMSQTKAQQLITELAFKRAENLRRGVNDKLLSVFELIASFWSGKNSYQKLNNLLAIEADKKIQGLLRLVYGQLLISCKLNAAPKHLEHGLQDLAGFLLPHDYLIILKRNELLSVLELYANPLQPATWLELETEAKVMIRMRGRPACLQAKKVNS